MRAGHWKYWLRREPDKHMHATYVRKAKLLGSIGSRGLCAAVQPWRRRRHCLGQRLRWDGGAGRTSWCVEPGRGAHVGREVVVLRTLDHPIVHLLQAFTACAGREATVSVCPAADTDLYAFLRRRGEGVPVLMAQDFSRQLARRTGVRPDGPRLFTAVGHSIAAHAWEKLLALPLP